MPNWWCLRAEAAPTDAEHVLRQSLALHRRAGALNRELKLAERSLADEPNEQNFARLLDIKTHLADLAHAEAAIEGFRRAFRAAFVADLIEARQSSRLRRRGERTVGRRRRPVFAGAGRRADALTS